MSVYEAIYMPILTGSINHNCFYILAMKCTQMCIPLLRLHDIGHIQINYQREWELDALNLGQKFISEK